MSAVNQQEILIFRLYSIDPGANGVYTVGTAATGWMTYPEGLNGAGVGVVLNRTGTGVYLITLPRIYDRQEMLIQPAVQDAFGTFSCVLGNTLGGVLPQFNTIQVSTFSDGGVTAANRNITVRVGRARVRSAAG